MRRKYKGKQLNFESSSLTFFLKRQRKNVTRRKKISLFRLKTLGFGFS
jgi:hypothetical protein